MNFFFMALLVRVTYIYLWTLPNPLVKCMDTLNISIIFKLLNQLKMLTIEPLKEKISHILTSSTNKPRLMKTINMLIMIDTMMLQCLNIVNPHFSDLNGKVSLNPTNIMKRDIISNKFCSRNNLKRGPLLQTWNPYCILDTWTDKQGNILYLSLKVQTSSTK